MLKVPHFLYLPRQLMSSGYPVEIETPCFLGHLEQLDLFMFDCFLHPVFYFLPFREH